MLIRQFEVGKANLFGPDLVHKAILKVRLIQEQLKMDQNHQNSYLYIRHRDLESNVDD